MTTKFLIRIPLIVAGVFFLVCVGYAVWRVRQPAQSPANTNTAVISNQRTDSNATSGEVATNSTVNTNSSGDANTPAIYVQIVSHNEDGLTPGYPNFVDDTSAYTTQRAGVVAFAEMLKEHHAKYDFQSDWNFLLALQAYDHGDASTNGKNLLQYLVQDLGMEVDPHSHEKNGYNYADVAYLISQLGVTPTTVVGGWIASPVSSSKLDYLRTLSHGSRYPEYQWKPTILWGGGTSLHQNEDAMWISGVWRPLSADQFDVDDPSGTLTNIGHYYSDWQGLDQLLSLQAAGKLEAGKMYTVTITSNQPDFTDAYIQEFAKKVDTYAQATEEGLIHWTTIEETYADWVNVYHSNPSILHWSGEVVDSSDPSAHADVTPSTNTNVRVPSGSRDNCGDGVCEVIERKSGVCSADCH